MANTLIPIQTYTLTSSSTGITFSNIPQNYTDLKLVVSARATTGESFGQLKVYPNGSTSDNVRKNIGTFGSSSVASYSDTDKMVGYVNGDSSTASTFSSTEVYFTNYTSSNYKRYSSETIVENSSTSVFSTTMYSTLWSSTSAITSLQVVVVNSSQTVCNILAGSTFTLYGISNGVKATGGTITVAGGYAYHTFTSTGSFLPNQRIKGAEILVVAGGGGGCGYGAGGAGGLSYKSPSTLTVGSYTAIVGSGGASGASAGGAVGGSGTNSVFAGITSNGGGGGRTNNTGLSGGSGAGGSYNNNAAGSATQGNTGGAIGYGNAGGAGYTNNSTIFNAGGGGGAGAAGAAGTATPVDGGDGLQTWALWATVTGTGESGYYAGGGGGCSRQTNNMGRGGRGGGGAGGNRNTSSAAGAAVANTGGGGGAGDDDQGGAGASGIIIVRYPLS
jgi:hypothetical protein